MRLNYLFLLLIVSLFSINSFAQERDFSIEISLKEYNRLLIGKDNLVSVKITNNSEQVLNPQDLKSLHFYVSRCPRTKRCSTWEDVYIASSKIEAKNLKQNESVEFQVNLADLYWNSAISSSFDFSRPQNFHTVPLKNTYFYADIKIFDKYLKLGEQSIQIPIVKSYESNEIVLESKLKPAKWFVAKVISKSSRKFFTATFCF